MVYTICIAVFGLWAVQGNRWRRWKVTWRVGSPISTCFVTPPPARTNLLSLFEHFYHKDGTGFGPRALQMLAKALFIVLAGHIVKFLFTPDKTHPLLEGLLC